MIASAKPRPKGSGDTLVFYVLGCKHNPLQDDECIDWHCKNIEELKPDLVVDAGDGFEADAASRHGSEYAWDIIDEFEGHDKTLARIRKANPNKNAEYIYLFGNHCDNILSPLRIDKKVRRAVDFRLERNCPELARNWKMPAKYEYCRESGVYRRGQVTFGHGYEHGKSADVNHSIILGVPYGLYVGAHTHKPKPVTQVTRGDIPLPYWYANVGMSRQFDPDYMKRKRQFLWGQAAVYGELKDIKSPRVSCEWSAETKVFRMFNDWAAKTKRKST